ncbi:hypothetical protein CE206_10005 [Achromobacter xylosoxidans]|nr:hypothetical protein CE206_10005 [Achromobacter xylosoxidans]
MFIAASRYSWCLKCSAFRPHAPPLRGSLPPEGAFLPWGGPAAKKDPHAPPLRGSLPPPRGGVFALGRPGGKKRPPRSAAARVAAPPRGRFCLGAARRQKKRAGRMR